MQFADNLKELASKNIKTIILPEGEDERVLRAADEVLGNGSVKLVVVGEKEQILKQAETLGLSNLEKAEFVSQKDEDLIKQLSEQLFEARKAKGLTLEEAENIVKNDVSYFATLFVQANKADGMVSGAIHTTAETIRPALQIIKTKPGRKTVSGAFFMCVPVFDKEFNKIGEKVNIYSDCAVNPNPTPEIIADIAIASDASAKAFGIESKIALLSYSTGSSGKGADVDATKEAAELLSKQAAEEGLSIEFEGPIQFDAATDVDVAKVKLPESKVAGKATVFVFPDLKSGNITYKAVQRNANALAIGPVLQGLNKPVNDLSRGAIVEDIINTIYLTAVQASA